MLVNVLIPLMLVVWIAVTTLDVLAYGLYLLGVGTFKDEPRETPWASMLLLVTFAIVLYVW